MRMAKILVLREKRVLVNKRERVIQKRQILYIEDISKDFHTKYGIIRKEDLKKKDGSTIKSSQGKEYTHH